LHGGGAWAALPPSGFSAVFADAAEWRGAAAAAGIPSLAAHDPPRDAALLVWDDLLAARLLHDWEAWVGAAGRVSTPLAALAHSAAVDLVLTGGSIVRRWRIRGADRLKFWRGRGAAQALAA
jgi:hypothetical protein